MKAFFTFILSLFIWLLNAQNVEDLRLERLYEEQFNHFYQADYDNALTLFDSIQVRTNNSTIESIQMALHSCQQLIKDSGNVDHLEELTIRKEYLTALLKWRNYHAAQSKLEENELKLADEELYRKSYNDNTIYPKNGRFIWKDQKYKLFELEDELMRFEDSAVEYELYKKNIRTSQLLITGTLVSYFAAALIGNKNSTVAGSLMLFGFSSNLVTIPFASRATNHWRKSIWHYNREVTLTEID